MSRWLILLLIPPAFGAGIRYIDLVTHSHTDVGFTDQPSVCREMQKRYLDTAIDACRRDPRFVWTAEAMLSVDDWWQTASAPQRQSLLELVREGRIEITAMPFNQTPFMDAAEWRQALSWIPDRMWDVFHPRVAMQNDVNGMPRAGAVRLLDRGVRYLYMGINADNGGPPFRRPSAFWWTMPDGRRLFVWLGESYGTAFSQFESQEWRRGPVPRAGDPAYRPPRAGDILRTDEASLRIAHKRCLERLATLEKGGYPYERILFSYTNQWRYDNDPPYPPLHDFVAAWNRLGLKPELRVVTASVALEALEKEAGARMPEHAGEWTDWWANGTASGPQEVAGSRLAKRLLEAALSPVWGPLTPSAEQRVEAMLKDLCLFDEHTWGSADSAGVPESLDSIAQYVEKSLLAYRPMGQAEWLLGQRARARLVAGPEGLYVTNTAGAPYTGWVRFPAAALRGDYRSLADPRTGRAIPLDLEPGLKQWGRPRSPADLGIGNTAAVFADKMPDQVARFWVEDLPARTTVRLELRKEAAAPAVTEAPRVVTDQRGWPVSATWPGMPQPLFEAGTGDFLAVQARGFAPRWLLREPQPPLAKVPAAPGEVTVDRTAHTTVYTQTFRHPSLRWAVRRLELWHASPRARLTVRFDRLSSDQPEFYFVNFTFPAAGRLPEFSTGGMPFVPFRDQLAGTCRDYYAIDGWARYQNPQGQWLWVSRDAPLVSVGGPHVRARISEPPADTHRLGSLVFENSWYTNFPGNRHGRMEFEYEMAWSGQPADPAPVAATMVSKPVVLINPATRESQSIIDHLYRP